MNLTTRQLTAFVHAARQRSFTRAAEQMHISQAGISLMMRELEAQVGCRLFDRTTRSVLLTAAGAALLPVAERALEDLSAAIGELNQLGARFRGTLRVGSTPLIAASVMPAVYQALRRSRPDLVLTLVDSSPEDLLRRVASGELDCGLGPFAMVPGIQRSLLFKFDLLYVRGPHSLAGTNRTARALPVVRWSELRDAPTLQLPADNPIQQLIAKQLKRHGIAPAKSPLTFNHMETIIGMASAGAGSAIIPSVALVMCRNNSLEVAKLVTPGLNVGLYLITRRGSAVPAALPHFTELLLQVLRHTLGGSSATSGRRR